jgi:hypothetical protein
MKILEAQSATLTNYEVYVHLKEQRARYAKRLKGRRPGNLETVVKEVRGLQRFLHLLFIFTNLFLATRLLSRSAFTTWVQTVPLQ